MIRSVHFAILAFSILICTNLAVFSYFYYRDFSKKIVTEQLMAGLNEAQSLVQQANETPLDFGDGKRATKRLAPQLRHYRLLEAVVVLDQNGRVIHREELVSSMFRDAGQPTSVFVPIASQHNADKAGTQLAIEYNVDALESEVAKLRQDLFGKIQIAIIASIILLSAGAAYVIWAAKRSKRAQLEAQKADRLAYVGTLASGLAHEIRNPLNSMNMNIQLLQEEIEEMGLGDDSEEIDGMFDSTKREIHRLERLVSSFLSYARPTQLQTKSCSVNSLVESVITLLKLEMEEKGIRLMLELSPDLPEIMLDDAQMRQALINVIQNAVQVSQSGDAIRIRTRTGGGEKILIIIRDEGPGIAPQELENIFKVFYSTRRGGTGLGLPIAQRIAELHGGGLKVDSEIGKGTTITFILNKVTQDV